MVSLYEILEDKYGEYYISYGKKHRLNTLFKKNKDTILKMNKVIQEDYYLEDKEYYDNWYKENMIDFKIIDINNKRYIQFGGC